MLGRTSTNVVAVWAGLAAIWLGAAAQPLRAAMAGAWETFYSKANTDAWYVFDYGEEIDFPPEWQGTPVDEEYAWFAYSSDYPVAFVADSLVGDGAFVGDYAEENIVGVACDAYIGKLADLYEIDCTLYADGPAGVRSYYSVPYIQSDFDQGEWWLLYFSFDDPWYYWDETAWVEVNAYELSAIETMEITFTPQIGITSGSKVGLDNVTLEADIVAPSVRTSLVQGSPKKFEMAFTPGSGMECSVQKMKTPPATGWDTVTGQTDIKGPAEHRFSTPATAGKEFFRVATEPYYTMVFSN